MEIILLTSATIVLFILLIIGIPYLRKTLPLKKIKASDLPSDYQGVPRHPWAAAGPELYPARGVESGTSREPGQVQPLQ